MNAILFPVFEFIAKHKWLQWLLLIVTGLVIIRIWMMIHDGNVRKLEHAENARRQAEVRVRVNERSTEIINEERHNADAALQARDRSPDFPSSDLVPDPVARIIFRD